MFEMHENAAEDPRTIPALKEILISHLSEQESGFNFMPWEFSMSEPRETVLEALNAGNFGISELTVGPGVKGGKSFDFKVGSIDFHLAGRAAERIENALRQAA